MPSLYTILLTVSVAVGAATGTSLRAEHGDRARSQLVPLSDADETSTTETGCTTTFSINGRDYLQLVGTELMLRDHQGLHSCRFSEADSDQLANGRGSVMCAGYRLRIGQTGRSTTNVASDSSSAPAILTIGQGDDRVTLRGIWGAAC